jgi:UDP-N-acetylmuramoyl-L-alanyl-D-glutamate--2,6-diaminopimelate ligase
MANVAVTYSDLAVITSDNTRFEEPEAIIYELVNYLHSQNFPSNRYVPIMDRKEAIGHAIEKVQPNDCIIIAGRGHETQLLIFYPIGTPKELQLRASFFIFIFGKTGDINERKQH